MASTRFYLDRRKAREGQPTILKLAIAHRHQTILISLEMRLWQRSYPVQTHSTSTSDISIPSSTMPLRMGLLPHYLFQKFKIKAIETAKGSMSVEDLRRVVYFP